MCPADHTGFALGDDNVRFTEIRLGETAKFKSKWIDLAFGPKFRVVRVPDTAYRIYVSIAECPNGGRHDKVRIELRGDKWASQSSISSSARLQPYVCYSQAARLQQVLSFVESHELCELTR